MALWRGNRAPQPAVGKIENILGVNTRFKGDLISDGNIRIDGLYEGNVETAGNVIIGPDARVIANIEASAVQVWGAVEGKITARGRLEILATGRVFGNVEVASMLIDDGGVFRGECLMGGEPVDESQAPEDGEPS